MSIMLISDYQILNTIWTDCQSVHYKQDGAQILGVVPHPPWIPLSHLSLHHMRHCKHLYLWLWGIKLFFHLIFSFIFRFLSVHVLISEISLIAPWDFFVVFSTVIPWNKQINQIILNHVQIKHCLFLCQVTCLNILIFYYCTCVLTKFDIVFGFENGLFHTVKTNMKLREVEQQKYTSIHRHIINEIDWKIHVHTSAYTCK